MTILTETENGPLVLSPDQIEELGRELDELRAVIVADLGERDREYLYSIIKAQRGFEIAGRGLMYLGFLPPFWLAAVAALSVSKILDNMEIGHNVMHGQYDWMREPGLNSRVFEWDTVCPADQWKHSHNYLHHTYTNIHNKDRDIGYSILRMDEAQEWNVLRLGQPLYAFVLMMLFEWGVMGHDLEVENILAGKKKWPEVKRLLLGQWRKAGKQVLKDYLVFPALTGPLFFHTLAGNATANLVRNVWAFAIIFCGHFPAGVQTFTEEETADETRGEWYIRQMLGSANITGSKLFHIMSGNLSHQIEHHLFPDLPASRYPEMAPTVRALCEKYGLPYNTGPLGKQIGSVWKKIFKLALPPRWVESEPSPGVIVMRQRKASEAGV
ncbi:acyl-CoA desaturase [Nocardia sp. CDC186]|uniref:Acyl-CoA desaturase n=1 Tax=Nocardia implantans TaxID=3108168 RepID=A0ABU6APS4_9NOCA|nr:MULTISPECIES: acyl-CoA desaturase [unclassified Nocardia]MBF6189728.1 acyl-CoA desaturase [Nocardia beijingensis]MEA3527042.1 acyl-CoA desaturase [Nocardia sp. CDC192]MEB3509380.1 acyl-CoA desaturase [Nocardia sp. CDC186]